jgi:hypothetical protein
VIFALALSQSSVYCSFACQDFLKDVLLLLGVGTNSISIQSIEEENQKTPISNSNKEQLE